MDHKRHSETEAMFQPKELGMNENHTLVHYRQIKEG